MRVACIARALLQLALATAWATAGIASAQQPAAGPALSVRGAVKSPLSLALAELRAMPQVQISDTRTVTVDGKEEKRERRYGGVLLRDLLERAGLREERRGDMRRMAVLLTASDGYRTLFSWGELYNTGVGERVLVVLTEEGRDLAPAEGPVALRSFADSRPGPRHVRWLVSVEVLLPGT